MGYNPPLIFGPIAPENNPPITPQYYQPSVFEITAMTCGSLTTITTAVNHNYVIGQQVRVVIPQPNGPTQLNESQSFVVSIPAANQVVTTLNSIGANTFVASSSSDQFVPQIMPIGDINSGQINTGRSGNPTYIPGSFIDISPV